MRRPAVADPAIIRGMGFDRPLPGVGRADSDPSGKGSGGVIVWGKGVGGVILGRGVLAE